MRTQWIEFAWDLSKLPTPKPLPLGYQIVAATPAMEQEIEEVVRSAYSMEQGWSTEMTSRLQRVQAVMNGWPQNGIEFLLLRHGSRLVGTCGVDPVADRADHLPTGVCILNEYRCRGLGTVLLHAALARLKERALPTARTVAKKGISAERYLYPKFGAKASDAVTPAFATA